MKIIGNNKHAENCRNRKENGLNKFSPFASAHTVIEGKTEGFIGNKKHGDIVNIPHLPCKLLIIRHKVVSCHPEGHKQEHKQGDTHKHSSCSFIRKPPLQGKNPDNNKAAVLKAVVIENRPGAAKQLLCGGYKNEEKDKHKSIYTRTS